MPILLHRGRLWCCLMVLAASLLTGCESGGHFTLFGYSTRPNYDCDIKTVFVPIFQNVTFRKYIEFQLTQAVVREIEAKTPYKVVSCREQADTELIGKIVNHRKTLINFNQVGEIREAENSIAVELIWRDLRPGHTGDLLSKEWKREDPNLESKEDEARRLGKPIPTAPPVIVAPVNSFIPELGGSLASANKQLVDRIAVQIVSMMEVWR